ncbi:MAG: 30S ribosomal protein S1 [Phycisphaeraceae bacterium]|nr:30S ribosomal protein S1 [Phycisphaerae bacterium]MBX3393557.1 30S ribosomal protein S1 [Phycisphaeraceae bacterium]HRJ50047.1 30S ribosomal protein S1 [Phycisphaerales bacterium]
MIDESLIASLGVNDAEAQEMISAAYGQTLSGGQGEYMDSLLGQQIDELIPGKLIKGKVIGFAGDDVVVEVGLKSEGLIPKEEFEGIELRPGDMVDVLLEDVEGEEGLVQLSKRKADRMLSWQRIMDTTKEGDVVEGMVTKKIKGGLLVDIGVPVFLPASQVDVRRPGEIGDYIGKRIRASILKIDLERRNIVISRRKLIEEERDSAKRRLLDNLKEGEIITGTVKNIADFGAFVDLGGIDGLLHITDMSWGRINHPSEILRIDQKVEVKVLNIDREKEKIALGLKQREASPWEEIEKKYPVGSRILGSVVNLMSYGAFVKLEDGIEGLVHISEMSWTRRVNHPSELVQPGQEVDVVVLEINKDKQEISLGMKQTEVNPWELVSEKYPPGTVIEGKVRNLANYGAFVEIEPGIDGLLHISDMSWTKKVTHPNEVLKKGDSVRCVVLDVDRDKQRVSLGVKQLTEDPWLTAIPEHYKPGMVVRGVVTKITNFGVFVELESDLEGLLHISELSDHKVENPQDVVKAGDEIDVKILRVDKSDRKIGLSLKRAQWGDTSGAEEPREKRRDMPTKGGMGAHDAMGTDKIRFQ